MLGKHLGDFIPNPSLQQSRSIPAACYFNEIVVDGPIFIQNEFNNVHFEGALSRVLYNSAENPVVTSLKRFNSLDGPIIATSGLINRKSIEQYFTTTTNQQFPLPSLCGNIIFRNLNLRGLFDFINVTELEQNVIKLSGEQYTEVNVAFEGLNGNPITIYANELQVLKTINDIDVHGFVATDESAEVHGNFVVEDLKVAEVILNGELIQKGQTLNGWNLDEFENLALIQGKHQRIQQPVYIKTAKIKKNLGLNQINGFTVADIIERLTSDRTNHDYMKDPKVHVERMVVEGSVRFELLNGFEVDIIERNAIYLNQPQTFHGSLRFLDDVVVNGNLIINHLMEKKFDEFVSSLVYRDENYIIVKGDTVFTEDIHVEESLEPQFTDGFETKRILSKLSDQTFYKPLKIYGNITTPGLNCKGRINSIDCKQISQAYQYDATRNVHIINANVTFDASIRISNLQMSSGLNLIPNVNEYLQDIVRKDRQLTIRGLKRFREFVHFDTNFKLLAHRGVDITNFLEKLVLIDADKIVNIVADVHFMDVVEASSMMIKGKLILDQNPIMNVNFNEWINNSISLSKEHKFSKKFVFGDGVLAISSAALQVHYINGKAMKDLITLHTPQHFPEYVHLGEVLSYVPVVVDGFVNAVNLTEEKENTLMVIGTPINRVSLINIVIVFVSISDIWQPDGCNAFNSISTGSRTISHGHRRQSQRTSFDSNIDRSRCHTAGPTFHSERDWSQFRIEFTFVRN